MDFILDEMEVELAANKLARYAEYLSRCMKQYRLIITDIEKRGYISDEFTKRLSYYKNSVGIPELETGVTGNQAAEVVKNFIDKVEEADNLSKLLVLNGWISNLM